MDKAEKIGIDYSSKDLVILSRVAGILHLIYSALESVLQHTQLKIVQSISLETLQSAEKIMGNANKQKVLLLQVSCLFNTCNIYIKQ